jgi:hypothetical protein
MTDRVTVEKFLIAGGHAIFLLGTGLLLLRAIVMEKNSDFQLTTSVLECFFNSLYGRWRDTA